MSVAYPHIAERLFGHAHLIEPGALRAIVDGPVGRRVLAGEQIEAKMGKRSEKIRRERLSSMVAAEPVRGSDGISEYALTSDGIAILSIAGVLSKRYDWLAAVCGWTTYDALGASLATAMNDYRVRAVLFDVDSPGGEASGMLDLADQILAARESKPVWAVANSLAASAAYALGGSAGRFMLPRLARVGSIGAVIVHVDQSAQDEARGLNYSAIFSGSRKIDGWDHAALSPAARTSFQASADHCRQSFADLVGRQGRISSKQAMETEAEMYADADAVKTGLADAVGTFDDAVGELTELVLKNSHSHMAASASNQGTSAMTTQKDQMLSTTSPSTIVAAQNAPAPAAAVAPVAEAPPAAVAAAKPGPGEKCATCGHVMPENDGDDDGKRDPDASANAYTVEMAIETMDLCAIAKVPVANAKAFVAAKTPLAKVRSDLAARAAAAADALAVDATVKPAGSAEQNVAAAWDAVITEQNAKLPQNTRR
jgi:ClpP class serine protease